MDYDNRLFACFQKSEPLEGESVLRMGGAVLDSWVMDIRSLPLKKYVLVCENERADGRASCGRAGQEIREKLKDRVKVRGLADRVRVARAGCLDVCAAGPNVVVWPEGKWFANVAESDLDAIVRYLEAAV